MEDAAPNRRLPKVQRSRTAEMMAEALRFRKSRLDPIRVFFSGGKWLVNYGSYVHGRHLTRAEAIETATKDARDESREVVVEAGPGDPKPGSVES